jgi:iron complex transport system permease protein
MESNTKLSYFKYFSIILSLLFGTLTVALISISIGSTSISFADVFQALFSEGPSDTINKIIFDIRLPRVLLGIAVGGGLSVAGAVFQATLMNPLAEPYILGVSSGGTFGAILSILLGISFIGTQFLAFSGALLVIFIVFFLGQRRGVIDPNMLLLSGVMIGAFFSALILLMMTFLENSFREAIFWIIGNLAFADFQSVIIILPLSIVISVILSVNAQKFNVLSLGDESARHLGVDVKRYKNITYILTSLLIGSAVSVTGIIGFVGLLVPHACRFIFGVDNRIVIPASFLIGAAYLVAADTIARTIIAPAQLPVGAITAIIGAPIFIYLLKTRFQRD